MGRGPTASPARRSPTATLRAGHAVLLIPQLGGAGWDLYQRPIHDHREDQLPLVGSIGKQLTSLAPPQAPRRHSSGALAVVLVELMDMPASVFVTELVGHPAWLARAVRDVDPSAASTPCGADLGSELFVVPQEQHVKPGVLDEDVPQTRLFLRSRGSQLLCPPSSTTGTPPCAQDSGTGSCALTRS